MYHVICAEPWFYERYFVDGGVLILSRYPIVDSEFRTFEFPDILADSTSKKGLLYAKVDLSEIGG